MHVDEIAWGGTVPKRQELVGCQILRGHDLPIFGPNDAEAWVDVAQVDSDSLAFVQHQQAQQGRCCQSDLHNETVFTQRAVNDALDLLHMRRGGPEEVQVLGYPIDDFQGDQRAAAGQRESVGLWDVGDCRPYTALQRCEHGLRDEAMAAEPRTPLLANMRSDVERIP